MSQKETPPGGGAKVEELRAAGRGSAIVIEVCTPGFSKSGYVLLHFPTIPITYAFRPDLAVQIADEMKAKALDALTLKSGRSN